MSSFLRVYFDMAASQATQDAQLLAKPDRRIMGDQLAELMDQISMGMQNLNSGNNRVATGCVCASGTVTFSSIANNDTVTINGRVYTAKTSGASGLQQFNIGGSDTAAAVNLAAAINADTSTLVKGVVQASASGAIVTVTCRIPGNIGNLCTLAISAHGSVSGANLANGSEGTVTDIPA